MSNLYVMHHTHWDREWYEPFALYQLRLAHVLHAVLDRLDDGTLPQFTLDGQTSLLTDALALRPDLRPRLQHYLHTGQLSIGPWFVSPDEWLICGEALIRNLQRGIAESQALLPIPPTFVGYLPDTFGHSADMPDLLHSVGIQTAMVWRGVPPSLSPVFWWHSPVDTAVRVLVYHLPEGYFQNVLHDPDLTDAQRADGFTQLIDRLKACHGDLPVLIPLGGDHLGPTPANPLLEGLTPIHPAGFMALLAEAVAGRDIPHYTGELLDNTAAHILPGVWSARLDVKIANRQCEHALLHRVEPAFHWLQQQTGHIPPTLQAGLDEAWRLLLLNHPHDSICGCSVDAVHADNLTRFTAIAALADRLVIQALHGGLGGNGLHTGQSGPARPLHVMTHWGANPFTGVVPVQFNQLPEMPEVTGLQVNRVDNAPLLNSYETDLWDVPLSHLTIRQTTGWLWVESLAPGVTPLPPSASQPPQPVMVTLNSLSNGLLTLTVTPAGQWLLAYGTGQSQGDLFSLTSVGEQGDSYNSAPDGAEAIASFTASKPGLPGPLAGSLILTYALHGMPVTVTVQLLANQPYLDITIQWFNTEPNRKLTAWLTQPEPLTAVWAESHRSVVCRPHPLPHTPPPLPLPRGQEWLPPSGPIQRFVMTPTQCVVTDGLTEYAVRNDRLGITLQRGFSTISRGDNPTRNLPAGPPFATPAAQLLNQTLTRRFAVGLMAPGDDPDIGYTWAERFYGVSRGQTVWAR